MPGAVAPRMTALDGSMVWINGGSSFTTLMRTDPTGQVSPVKGAPVGPYRSIDLGRDVNGDLVLTYLLCAGGHCRAYADDLNGHRTLFKRLVPKRCELTAAPSMWRDRVAYGLDCSRLRGAPGVHDRPRSGLFTRKGTGPAKRLTMPVSARRYGIAHVRRVDLRGTTIGAGVQPYALQGRYFGEYVTYAQSTSGKLLRSRYVFDPSDEGDSQGLTLDGLALGAGSRLWTLNGTVPGISPYEATIVRSGLSCADLEILVNPSPTSTAPYAMAVDGATIYLYVPGVGIVTHAFAPAAACPV